MKVNNLIYINNFINHNNMMFHTLIKDKNGNIVSRYNNTNYILMRINFSSNRLLTINDIYDLKKYTISYIKKNNFNWINLWKNKINQVNHYIINNKLDINDLAIINYYLILCDIAIYIFNTKVNNDNISLTLCHNRIGNYLDLYEYYSINNLLIDNITRDLGEYIKNYIFSEKLLDINQFMIISNLTINEKYMLISRILFPSYFFDIFDEFVINKKDFNDFSKKFKNIELYENNLYRVISFILK